MLTVNVFEMQEAKHAFDNIDNSYAQMHDFF